MAKKNSRSNRIKQLEFRLKKAEQAVLDERHKIRVSLGSDKDMFLSFNCLKELRPDDVERRYVSGLTDIRSFELVMKDSKPYTISIC